MGAIGGTIVIGALVVVFLFLKKRRSKVTNPLPDFADDTLGEQEKRGGFKKLFGAKATAPAYSGEISGFNDLENQLNQKSAAFGGSAAGAYGSHDTDNDFEYRGVTNSNNLDSVFKSTASNTGQNTTGQTLSSASMGQGHLRGHSRYNSVLVPQMDTMHEGGYYDEGAPYPTEDYPLTGEQEKSDVFGDRSSDDLDDDLLFHQAPHQLWSQDHKSNNSRLRFTEEI